MLTHRSGIADRGSDGTLPRFRSRSADSRLARALGGDAKGKLSMGAYAAAVPVAFVMPWISVGLYVGVALLWLVPDTRIESRVR